MHCHIAWHVSEGLAVQFLEDKSSMKLPDDAWKQTCTNWQNHIDGGVVYRKDDSGL
jgi:hypothetical protein